LKRTGTERNGGELIGRKGPDWNEVEQHELDGREDERSGKEPIGRTDPDWRGSKMSVPERSGADRQDWSKEEWTGQNRNEVNWTREELIGRTGMKWSSVNWTGSKMNGPERSRLAGMAPTGRERR
jgi:hypothetical protein